MSKINGGRLARVKQVTPTKAEIKGVEDGDGAVGECYYAAGLYVLEHCYTTLVHGTCRLNDNAPFLYGHGWVVVSDDKVYDGTVNKFFDKDSYYETLEAVDEVEYTWDELTKILLKAEHWGCWHMTKGVTSGPNGYESP